MKKLSSFAEFSETKRINAAAALKEEQEIKRSGEANSFKSLLTEFGVSGIKELSEEQRSDFFNKLRNLGVNESNSLITEGTRSQVGVISKSGKITSTYVHHDGYPEHMLPMLNGYSESDIKQLMKLGKSGISFLDKSIGKKHSFSEPTRGYTIFYGRDRGENNDMITTGQYKKVDQYLNDVSNGAGAEWVYLWDEEHKNWLVADIYGDKELMPSSTFESVVNESEAENILQDLLDERGGDMGEFHGMEMEDALDTVESYGHKGSKAKKIAQELFSMCNESVVTEAIKVEYKRDAKKVVTQYKKIFYKLLPDLGAMSTASILGCVKYICQEALGDANFHREAEPTAKKIKGKIEALEIKMPGLGGHFVKIGSTTIKSILDKHYSDIANAAGWSGIGIAEGTALFLEELKQEQMGQDVLDAFNAIYAANESVVNEAKFVKDFDKGVLDAEYKADITAYYPSAKFFMGKMTHFFGELEPNLYFKAYYAKYYKQDTGNKIDGEFKITSIYSEKGRNYVNLYVESANTVEAPNVNEAEIKTEEDFKEYAYGVLKKAFGEEFDQAKADEVVDGILSKADGDYGKAAGILQSSLA